MVLTMDPTLCQACSMPLGERLAGLACSLAIESQSLSGPWQQSVCRAQLSSAPGSGTTGYFSLGPQGKHCLLLRPLLVPCGEDSCVALGLAWCPLPLSVPQQCLPACHLPSGPATGLR